MNKATKIDKSIAERRLAELLVFAAPELRTRIVAEMYAPCMSDIDLMQRLLSAFFDVVGARQRLSAFEVVSIAIQSYLDEYEESPAAVLSRLTQEDEDEKDRAYDIAQRKATYRKSERRAGQVK